MQGILSGLIAAAVTLTLGLTPSSRLDVHIQPPEPVAAPARLLYQLDLTGEFGREVALTPVKDALKDARELHPAILVVTLDSRFVMPKDAAALRFRSQWDENELARSIGDCLTRSIGEDRFWTPKPRVVCWVRHATGSAAMLPFAIPEIYFTRTARHGGINLIDLMGMHANVPQRIDGHGRSLRAGRMEAMALRGGHAVELIRAMYRVDYVLSATIENGKPTYFEDTSGSMLLTDDGSKEANRRAPLNQIPDGTIDDLLILDADTALKLGFSKGIFDTQAELVRALDRDQIGHAPITVTSGASPEIFRTWIDNVVLADKHVPQLVAEANALQKEKGVTRLERESNRNRRTDKLNQALDLLKNYGESMDPGLMQTGPDGARQSIRTQIEMIRQESRLDPK